MSPTPWPTSRASGPTRRRGDRRHSGLAPDRSSHAGAGAYIESIRKHDITFAVGPAGTGKTYLAVAVAVEALKHHQTRKIVLVRPAVEAGESLGFLPGDLRAKINPYLRPLLDDALTR